MEEGGEGSLACLPNLRRDWTLGSSPVRRTLRTLGVGAFGRRGDGLPLHSRICRLTRPNRIETVHFYPYDSACPHSFPTGLLVSSPINRLVLLLGLLCNAEQLKPFRENLTE